MISQFLRISDNGTKVALGVVCTGVVLLLIAAGVAFYVRKTRRSAKSKTSYFKIF